MSQQKSKAWLAKKRGQELLKAPDDAAMCIGKGFNTLFRSSRELLAGKVSKGKQTNTQNAHLDGLHCFRETP